MRLSTTQLIPSLIFGVVLVAGCASSSSPPLNFGDGSVSNLWYWAEARRVAGDPDQSVVYMDRIISQHSPKALKQQASLSDYPPVQKIYGYVALNGVGKALVGKGEILMEKGDKAGAKEAFNTIIRDFSYAQFQKTGQQTVWLKAVDVAREKLKGL